VANYGATSILRSGGSLNVTTENGKTVVRGRYAKRLKVVDGIIYELGDPHALYLNDGKGVFTSVSWAGGRFLDEKGQPLTESPSDQGLSVIFYDINQDGAPDLYVCNDAFTPDRCWINDGTGRFRALDTLAWRSSSYFSMGADFADINRDGHPDFFVVDMLSRKHELRVTQRSSMHVQPRVPGDLEQRVQMRRNTLFLGRGDTTFAEIANFAGVAGSEWSWSGVFVDVDLDGWEDILVSNGFPFNMDDMDLKERIEKMGTLPVEQSRRTLLLYPPLKTPNVAFRNKGDMTFDEVGKEWGFDSAEVSNGMALGDLDNDGDLDVVINCFDGPALLYRNGASNPRLAVRLKGESPNTQGIGAKIEVTGGPVKQSQEVICGGRYVSGDDPVRVFACGQATNKLTITVKWRNGTVSFVENAEPGMIYSIDEEGATNSKASVPAPKDPLFTDRSDLLKHRHHEPLFDDFAVQSSLPNKLSQLGPGIVWSDLDGDGWEDLVIGAGEGGEIAVLKNEAGKGFTPLKVPGTKTETAGMVALSVSDKQAELIFGHSNFEKRGSNLVSRINFANGSVELVQDMSLKSGNSVGPLAIAEVEGEMVLFVGERFVPGRYPQPASGYLYRRTGEGWILDRSKSEKLVNIGLVSGAVWSDLTGDGKPELVLACEWGGIRVFHFEGDLKERTVEWGLSSQTGRWQSVTAGDFNGDGRMDLVAGNWGLNDFYQQEKGAGLEFVYGDLSGDGRMESVQSFRTKGSPTAFPWLDKKKLAASFPWLNDSFPTHVQFSKAGISEIFRASREKLQIVPVHTLASTLFLNQGSTFEPRTLPVQAQLAPVFGICVADLDGDGNEDLLLAQNFFGSRPEDGRMDAGRGLYLRGDGLGEFEAIDGRESGILVYGEQRGCAAADFDGDGRVDLAISQNGGETKLYTNRGAKPGLRIRLRGRGQNWRGIGAKLNLTTSQGGRSQFREVHAGGGYWSQDGSVQVLAAGGGGLKLHVRWSGGSQAAYLVPKGAREIEVFQDGSVNLIR